MSGIKKTIQTPAKNLPVKRQANQDNLFHLIEVVLGIQSGSETHMSLQNEGVQNLLDFLCLPEADVDKFEVTARQELRRTDKFRLKLLLKWARYLHTKDMSTP